MASIYALPEVLALDKAYQTESARVGVIYRGTDFHTLYWFVFLLLYHIERKIILLITSNYNDCQLSNF